MCRCRFYSSTLSPYVGFYPTERDAVSFFILFAFLFFIEIDFFPSIGKIINIRDPLIFMFMGFLRLEKKGNSNNGSFYRLGANFSGSTPAESAKGPEQSILWSAEREREGRLLPLALSVPLVISLCRLSRFLPTIRPFQVAGREFRKLPREADFVRGRANELHK